MRWLDCSAYTGELSPSFLDAVVENGVEGLAVQLYGGTPSGTGLNPQRFQQLNLARSRGLRVAGYSWPALWAAYAIVNTPGYPFEFMGLDVEAGAGMTRLDVDRVKELDIWPVKYASPHTWDTIMGNSTDFADVDTWLARYFQQGWLPWETVAPYSLRDGSRTMMVQIQGTTTLRDDQFDLNVADRTWFNTQGGDDMPESARALAVLEEINQHLYNIDVESDPLYGNAQSMIDETRAVRALLEQILTALTTNSSGAHTHTE